MYKEIIIVRHLRTLHNIGISDYHDSDITSKAQEYGPLLGNFFLDRMSANDWTIYTSPFLRCLRTAEFIRKSLQDTQCIVEPLCREYLEPGAGSVLIPNHSSDFGDMYWRLSHDMEFKPETNEAFILRIRQLHDTLPDKAIVVTHGLPAFVLMHLAANHQLVDVPMWDWSLDNGSITWVKDGRIIFRGLNLYWEEGCYPNGAIRDRYIA